MKNITKLEVAEELKPDYEFWTRQGTWELREAAFLLLDIEPRLADEEYRNNHTELQPPQELTPALKEMISLLETGPYAYYGHPSPNTVLSWVLKKKIPIPQGLKEAADNLGLLKDLDGSKVDYAYWLLSETWDLEIAVCLIRGLPFEEGKNRFGLNEKDWAEFQRYHKVFLNVVTGHVVKSKPKMNFEGLDQVGYYLKVESVLLWALDKGIIIPEKLKIEAEQFKKIATQTSFGVNLVVDESPIDKKFKPLRPEQRHREQSRGIAKLLWNSNPDMTIDAMLRSNEITKFGCDGKSYHEDNIRKWLNDLAPNRSPGRPKSKPPTVLKKP